MSGGRGMCEALEARRLRSVTVEDGVAVIRGTDGDDVIVFSLYTSWEQIRYNVKVNGVAQPSPSGWFKDFDRFVIDAGRGHDRVRVVRSTFRVDVFGRAGDDRVSLNAGGLVKGAAGDDVLNAAGPYSTTLYGGAGGDLLIGGDKDGELYGGDDQDTLYGGVGRDLLDGGSGSDSLHGGAGDDVLVGGGGFDRLFGQSGADALHVSMREPHDAEDEDDVLLA